MYLLRITERLDLKVSIRIIRTSILIRRNECGAGIFRHSIRVIAFAFYGSCACIAQTFCLARATRGICTTAWIETLTTTKQVKYRAKAMEWDNDLGRKRREAREWARRGECKIRGIWSQLYASQQTRWDEWYVCVCVCKQDNVTILYDMDFSPQLTLLIYFKCVFHAMHTAQLSTERRQICQRTKAIGKSFSLLPNITGRPSFYFLIFLLDFLFHRRDATATAWECQLFSPYPANSW